MSRGTRFSIPVQTSLSDTTAVELADCAARMGMTTAALVRLILTGWLERNADTPELAAVTRETVEDTAERIDGRGRKASGDGQVLAKTVMGLS